MFPLFLLAVVAAAMLGRGPGILATALSGYIAETVFMHADLSSVSASSASRMALWWGEGLLICAIMQQRRSAQRREAAHATDAEEHDRRDHDRRAQLEARLRQAQRMEAVGNLAGGIAHDFNNILTAIISNAQLMLTAESLTQQGKADLDEIVRNGVRAAGLTRQLLTFSRRQMVEGHVVSVYMTVNEIVPMLRRLIGEDIEIRVEADPNTGTVWADQSQVEQLILNLVVNARDAMPQGGTLRIATQPHRISGHRDLPDGSYVEIVVEDTGQGMTEECKARVFEPFYTTKEGKGSGLGLCTVYGIVKNASGHVFVESQPGHGARFTIWLPSLEQPAVVAAPEAVPGKIEGQCRVLLVEDEQTVQNVLTRALTEWGYEVVTASNGREARQVLQREQVDIVVTDVVMPEMGGRQLGELIAHEYPGLPVIYMTGYTTDDMIRRGVQQNRINFIQKPFDFKLLITKIQEVLDARRCSAGTVARN